MRKLPVARAVAVLGSVAIAGALTLQLAGSMGEDLRPVEIALIAVFAVLVFWVAANFWASALGFLSLARRAWRRSPPRPTGPGAPIGKRLVVVMPIYEEDAKAVFGRLLRVYRSLENMPRLQGFHLFVLSDTRSDAVADQEAVEFRNLRQAARSSNRIFYRRRASNEGRKAGNIREFIETWGGHYDYMLVLDADSLMDGKTVLRLADHMEADPRLGLIQTWPRLIGSDTLFGRLQQFATSVYGQLPAEGYNMILGAEGSYWGHNALIRTRAFAESCGLPRLSGAPPFGGEILSHDFVEAALLVSKGWNVRILSERLGSFEEPPPTLIASAARDRRWAQGNLQHLRLVLAPGLTLASRAHLAMGAMNYLASPIWLLFLILATAVFLGDPVSPQQASTFFADAVRQADWGAILLLAAPLSMLFAPKLFGLTLALTNARTRRASGGVLGLLASSVFETVYTFLLAPIMMLLHTWFVLEILMGRSSGWKPQVRDSGGDRMRDLLIAHAPHTAIGVAAIAGLWIHAPAAAIWMSPVMAGLVLSVPLSWISGQGWLGRACRRVGLFLIPEETAGSVMLPTRIPVAQVPQKG